MSTLLATTLLAGALAGGRAADGEDVVLKRLYPKTRTFELEAGAGLLLNPTFVDTALARASLRYHWSETWGLGLAAAAAAAKDRDERGCVESFYNDPLKEGGAPCHAQDDGASLEGAKEMSIGPAYPGIRELTGLVMGFGDYTLAYGKQILLHGAVSHFDLRVRFGGGVVLSRFYEAIGTRPELKKDATDLYGEAGRPEPRAETSPCLYLALAEELHFGKHFFLAGELAGYVMTSVDRGIEPFFVAHLGLGLRL